MDVWRGCLEEDEKLERGLRSFVEGVCGVTAAFGRFMAKMVGFSN